MPIEKRKPKKVSRGTNEVSLSNFILFNSDRTEMLCDTKRKTIKTRDFVLLK
jgi:hypothetical protein